LFTSCRLLPGLADDGAVACSTVLIESGAGYVTCMARQLDESRIGRAYLAYLDAKAKAMLVIAAIVIVLLIVTLIAGSIAA
jgi:hypothetical protein